MALFIKSLTCGMIDLDPPTPCPQLVEADDYFSQQSQQQQQNPKNSKKHSKTSFESFKRSISLKHSASKHNSENKHDISEKHSEYHVSKSNSKPESENINTNKSHSSGTNRHDCNPLKHRNRRRSHFSHAPLERILSIDEANSNSTTNNNSNESQRQPKHHFLSRLFHCHSSASNDKQIKTPHFTSTRQVRRKSSWAHNGNNLSRRASELFPVINARGKFLIRDEDLRPSHKPSIASSLFTTDSNGQNCEKTTTSTSAEHIVCLPSFDHAKSSQRPGFTRSVTSQPNTDSIIPNGNEGVSTSVNRPAADVVENATQDTLEKPNSELHNNSNAKNSGQNSPKTEEHRESSPSGSVSSRTEKGLSFTSWLSSALGSNNRASIDSNTHPEADSTGSKPSHRDTSMPSSKQSLRDSNDNYRSPDSSPNVSQDPAPVFESTPTKNQSQVNLPTEDLPSPNSISRQQMQSGHSVILNDEKYRERSESDASSGSQSSNVCPKIPVITNTLSALGLGCKSKDTERDNNKSNTNNINNNNNHDGNESVVTLEYANKRASSSSDDGNHKATHSVLINNSDPPTRLPDGYLYSSNSSSPSTSPISEHSSSSSTLNSLANQQNHGSHRYQSFSSIPVSVSTTGSTIAPSYSPTSHNYSLSQNDGYFTSKPLNNSPLTTNKFTAAKSGRTSFNSNRDSLDAKDNSELRSEPKPIISMADKELTIPVVIDTTLDSSFGF